MSTRLAWSFAISWGLMSIAHFANLAKIRELKTELAACHTEVVSDIVGLNPAKADDAAILSAAKDNGVIVGNVIVGTLSDGTGPVAPVIGCDSSGVLRNEHCR